MTVEKKLYTGKEVVVLIKAAVHDISQKLANFPSASGTEQSTLMRQWASELLPSVEEAVAEEVVRRHVQGVSLSVWVGPSSSGKSTNVEAVNTLGKVYAEVASQGVARVLEEPYHSMLLKYSAAQTIILTGTKGMFNRPEGEYQELFGELVPLIGKLIADGGYAPDNMVSVLVELMLLYRLTQNFHNIQIDLWPRTGPQFDAFNSMLDTVKRAGGKISKEVVIIKVVSPASLSLTRSNIQGVADASQKIAQKIRSIAEEPWYKEVQQIAEKIVDYKERFTEEEKVFNRVIEILTAEFTSDIDKTVLEEFHTIYSRLKFRFELVLSKGFIPRPDEHPLSFVRKTAIYFGETSPAFLAAIAKNASNGGYYIVSSAGTPEEVVADILDTLAGRVDGDQRWQAVKKVAGELAVAIVYKKELIVDELVQRVGGILNA